MELEMTSVTTEKTVQYQLAPGSSFDVTFRRPMYSEAGLIYRVFDALSPIQNMLARELKAEHQEAATKRGEPIEGDIVVAPSAEEQLAAIDASIAACPPGSVRQIFSTLIVSVAHLRNQHGPILTGEQLHEIADIKLLRFVISELIRMVRLTADEGKDSASRSISDVAPQPETAASISPAPSIEHEAGTPISTAPEIPVAIV